VKLALNRLVEQLQKKCLRKDVQLGRDEAINLADLGGDDLPGFFACANRIRRARFGNEVKFCSIAAGKVGACGEDCKWCAQSARYAGDAATIGPQKQERERKRATPDELALAASQAKANGASSFGIVNSGRRPSEADLAVVEAAVARIGQAGALQLCASLGELDDATAERLQALGITRYNHNLETSRRFYPTVVTTHAYDDRLRTLAAASRAGMSLCCGGIFGLGETWADRVDLAMTLRDQVHPQVVPLNFLHPIPGTPLEGVNMLTPLECLKIIAIYRLILPEADLKVAGGRELNLRDLQSWMFYAGATSCLVGNYLTTCGRDTQADRQMVADLGLELVDNFSEPDSSRR